MSGETSNPLLAKRQVGRRLREWRQAAGRSRQDVADYMGCGLPKVSKFENGESALPLSELRLLGLYYGRDVDETDAVFELGRTARKHPWWRQHGSAIPEHFRNLASLEADSLLVENYEPETVHGLSQTPEYAEAILRKWRAVVTTEAAEADRSRDLRLARQRRIEQAKTPYRAYINETTLWKPVGGHRTMTGQCQHLLDIIAERDNMDVRVIPEGAGEHVAMGASITKLDLPDADPLVYLEMPTTGIYVEEEAEVNIYILIFEDLRKIAAEGDHAADLIRNAMARHERLAKKAGSADESAAGHAVKELGR